MKKIFLILVILLASTKCWAYDVEYKNNIVSIKKSALTQVIASYGVMYDSYCSCYREYGKVSFSFKIGSFDPSAKNAFVKQQGGIYKEPSGDENVNVIGDVINIPYSLFASSNSIQIEPDHYDRIEDMVDDILPLYITNQVIRSMTNYTQTIYK